MGRMLRRHDFALEHEIRKCLFFFLSLFLLSFSSLSPLFLSVRVEIKIDLIVTNPSADSTSRGEAFMLTFYLFLIFWFASISHFTSVCLPFSLSFFLSVPCVCVGVSVCRCVHVPVGINRVSSWKLSVHFIDWNGSTQSYLQRVRHWFACWNFNQFPPPLSLSFSFSLSLLPPSSSFSSLFATALHLKG